MDRPTLEAWVRSYERAWRAVDTDGLAGLFAPDATYSPAPYREPWKGLSAIAEMWEAERDGPDEVFTMSSEVVAVERDIGVVRVHVGYGDPVRQEYRDLWVVRLDDEGRCVSFEEWPFWPEGSFGGVAGEA